MSKVIHINSSREKRIPDSFVQNENLSIESIGLGVYLNSLPKTYIPRPHLIREHFKSGNKKVLLRLCTGAGKTTLANALLHVCQEQGIDIVMGDDLVLKQIRLQRVNSRLARTLLVDLCSLFACLVTWRKNHDFYVFALRIIRRLPVAWFEKLNLARNVLKKIGIYEIIRRRGSGRQVVLVDEGTLHAAHNLFVHVSIPPNADDVATFARLVPLPDVTVYVRQPKPVLIERTLERGHKCIPDHSYANAELFVKRAVETFDKLWRQSMREGRLLVVYSQQDIRVGQDCLNQPPFALALKIIRAGLEAVTADHPSGMMPGARVLGVQPASKLLR